MRKVILVAAAAAAATIGLAAPSQAYTPPAGHALYGTSLANGGGAQPAGHDQRHGPAGIRR